MLVLGGLFGGVATVFNRLIGLTFLLACAAGGGVLFAARQRVQRLSRWTAASSISGALAFFGGLCVVGASIAGAMLDRGVMLWAASLFVTVAALLWRRGLARREAEWDRARGVNEREILRLADGTYDVGRGFVYDGVDTSDARAKLARAGPWVAVGSAVAAGAGRYAAHDLREYFLMVIGPIVFLSALPAIAVVATTWRKIREYERRLGRDIVNR